jgi:hypothetical protein
MSYDSSVISAKRTQGSISMLKFPETNFIGSPFKIGVEPLAFMVLAPLLVLSLPEAVGPHIGQRGLYRKPRI